VRDDHRRHEAAVVPAVVDDQALLVPLRWEVAGELTQAEAAQVLGVSAATVNRRLNRGLELLAEALSDLRPDDEVSSSS